MERFLSTIVTIYRYKSLHHKQTNELYRMNLEAGGVKDDRPFFFHLLTSRNGNTHVYGAVTGLRMTMAQSGRWLIHMPLGDSTNCYLTCH